MSAVSPDLTVQLKLNSAGLTKGLSSVRSQLMGMGKEAGAARKHVDGLKATLGGVWRITGGILLFNVIRHITHSIRDLIKTTLDFETQMYNVNSVAQMGAEDFKKLQNQVLDLALDPRIKDGPAALAAGLYLIVSAGYSAADSLVIMEQAALASTAGMTTSKVAADVLISTLGAYNLTVDSAAGVTNTLFQIVNISKYTFEDLAAALDSVTPTASALGIGLNEVGAAMATMASRGVDSQTSTVQMNAILSALLKPTDAMSEALHNLGYETGQQMIQALGFTKTMTVWADVLNGDAGKAAELFGDVRALRGLMNLTNDGTVKLTENLEKMGQAQEDGGAMTRALNEQMKANSFQMAVLRKNVQILAILGFGTLAPYLNRALVGINTFLVGSIKGFRHFREKGYSVLEAMRAGIKKTLIDMFGSDVATPVLKFFDTLVSFFMTVKGIVQAVWGPLKEVLGFMVDHFNIIGPLILGAVIGVKAFGIALAALKIALLIINLELAPLTIIMLAFAAIGALVAVAWINNWGDIQGKTHTAVQFIGKWLGKLWDFISPVIDGIKKLGHYWKSILNHDIEPGNLANVPGWLQPIAIIIGRVLKTIRVFIITWRKLGALAAFKTLPVQIRAFGRAVAGLLAAAGLKHYAAVFKDAFNAISHIVRDVIDLIDDLVHGRWSEVWKDLKQLALDALDLLWAELRAIPAILIDLFNLIPWGKLGSLLWKGFKLAVMFLITKGIPFQWKVGLALLGFLLKGMVSIWTTKVKPWLLNLPDKILKVFSGALNLLYSVGNAIISGLSSGITFGWNWMMSWLVYLPAWIVNTFGQPLYILWQVGAELIMGLWNGIVWAWHWLETQLAKLWDQLPGWAKKVWDVMSPSKVFADIGKNLSLGLAVGIQAGMPEIKRAMGQMTATSSISMGSPGRSGFGPALAGVPAANQANGSGNRIYNVTNNIYDAQDPNKVADTILTAMKRMEEAVW